MLTAVSQSSPGTRPWGGRLRTPRPRPRVLTGSVAAGHLTRSLGGSAPSSLLDAGGMEQLCLQRSPSLQEGWRILTSNREGDALTKDARVSKRMVPIRGFKLSCCCSGVGCDSTPGALFLV